MGLCKFYSSAILHRAGEGVLVMCDRIMCEIGGLPH